MVMSMFIDSTKDNKVVFFDLDATLYDYNTSHLQGLKSSFSVWKNYYPSSNFKEFQNLYKEARKWVKRFHRDTASAHNRALYFQKLVELNGDKLDSSLIIKLNDAYWEGALENIIVFPGLFSAIKTLKTEYGFKMGIISNMGADIQYRKLLKLGMEKMFDGIITSEEVGHEKPHPLIYSHSLNLFAVKPENAWMIGDSFINDVEAPAWLGINAIWFNPEKEDLPKIAEDVIFEELSNYDNLVSLIDKKIAKNQAEGYIKYKLTFIKKDKPIIDLDQIKELNSYRNEAFKHKLIGYYFDNHPETPNVGYGNISQRYTTDGQFLISGTKTGKSNEMTADEWPLVIDYNINENHVYAKGVVQPSSESMTHAAIYEVAKDVNFILHIHNLELWTHASVDHEKKGFYSTPADITYGTPEMAKAIQKIYLENKEKSYYKPVVMLGHKEGLIMWGPKGEDLVNLFLEKIKEI